MPLNKHLAENGFTCVAGRPDPFYTSNLKGIAPLMRPLLEDPSFFKEADIADKVIGKSAAMLILYGQAKSLHATLISEHACALLDRYGFPYTYESKVPFIENNARTGMCPMEASVLATDDPQAGFEILKAKFLAMNANKNS